MGEYNFGQTATPSTAWMEYGVNVALTAWKNSSNNTGGPGRIHAMSAYVDASPDFGNPTTTFHIDLWYPAGGRFTPSNDYSKGRGTGSWAYDIGVSGGDKFVTQQDFILGWYRPGSDSIGFRTTGSGATNLSDSNDINLTGPYAASPYQGDPGVYATIFLSDVYVRRSGGWNRLLNYPRRSGGYPGATIPYVNRGGGSNWRILDEYIAAGGELSRRGIRCMVNGEEGLLIESEEPAWFGSIDVSKLGNGLNWGPDHPSCRSLRRASWEPDWLVDAKEHVRDLAEWALKEGHPPTDVAQWQIHPYRPQISEATKWVGPVPTIRRQPLSTTRHGRSSMSQTRVAPGRCLSGRIASSTSRPMPVSTSTAGKPRIWTPASAVSVESYSKIASVPSGSRP